MGQIIKEPQFVNILDRHDSTTSDFCSECGLEMRLLANADQNASGDVAGATRSTSRENCPICKTERDEPQAVFCGVCGFNFVTGQGGAVVASLVLRMS